MVRKKKFKHDYLLMDMYKFYSKLYDDPVDYKTFAKVIDSFNSRLVKEIYKGAYIDLPYSLGDLYIYKYKPKFKFDEEGNIILNKKFKMIDYKATNELWKKYPELEHKQRVFYDNFHTDGFKFRITWKRYHTNRYNKLYNFVPARAFQRDLASYLREHPNQSYYDK
jgi:hypothetical protein